MKKLTIIGLSVGIVVAGMLVFWQHVKISRFDRDFRQKNAPVRFAIARGDVAFVEVTTNNHKGRDYYLVHFKPTSQKEAELYKLAEQHPTREIEVDVGSTPDVKMQVLASALQEPFDFQVPCLTHEQAMAVERGLKELSQ
jgi:hypothetical protein